MADPPPEQDIVPDDADLVVDDEDDDDALPVLQKVESTDMAPATRAAAAEAGAGAKSTDETSPNDALTIGHLLQYFVKYGTRRVSDLHIKVGAPPVFRIDGRLRAMTGPPLDEAAVARLVKQALSQQDHKRMLEMRSVDCSFEQDGHHYRLNAFHDSHGLAMAVRAIESVPPPIKDIGFPNKIWQDIVNKRAGLVLVTGVTGSGKSTTIAALIRQIAETLPCRVITLEDPIEFRMHSNQSLISQRELGRDVPSFERGIRDCLREDPDVIFVGEMRDRDSAAWTLTAAETGHLVFSTLHTRDVRGTITRIMDMFPENRKDEVAGQLALGLSHVVCQKLVPRSDGNGRVVAMELLTNNFGVANLIRVGKVEQLYSMMQIKTRDIPDERMQTLEWSLANLVMSQAIDAKEAVRWANNPGEFQAALRFLQG